MNKISEILALDLQEDIKNVIDLEDQSEHEIQQEIESYIVTEGIGRHLYDFIAEFSSNIKETGVWLSGFYGSGKSYFGKMLGYLLDNPTINGTPARERFIPRLKGISDESLIESSIRRLGAINSRVIFLDVAKQNTDKGLAYTLFANLLKKLGFRDDLYGFMEFDLYIEGKLNEFESIVKSEEGLEWNELRKSSRQVARVMRKAYIKMGFTEDDYNDTLEVYKNAIEDFSANKFKVELEKYLSQNPDETLVFVFDEASEAISQQKFSLLDLEGISEALSSIKSKVWTIAIAQEKLDDVINNTNVSRSQLTKVTDRFKTKIHLESTEVDVIIRSRLLKKKPAYFEHLKTYFKEHEGQVLDTTNLKSSFPTKTKDAEDFATYYPFHRYQFDVLQKFLFSSNALVATQIAARGMIITTFDVLRKQLRDKELYHFSTAYNLCTEAQTAPPVQLVNKYDSAKRILKEVGSVIDGEKLLKTIHILVDAELVSATVENITKAYIFAIDTYYELKPSVEEALDLLVESKVLLVSNNHYKITSDLEGKLLEEMKDFGVELFKKKGELIKCLQKYKLFNPVASLNEGSESFKFFIHSDQDDVLVTAGSKELNLCVFNLFNLSDDRQEFIENLKLETQYDKGTIRLVPDNTHFKTIDKLIEEVLRYSYMEEKYANDSDQNKRQIIRDFAIIREEKEKELRLKIEQSYQQGNLIYMFDEWLLNADTFKGSIQDTQRKQIKNIYTKRLASSLSESLVPKIFKQRKEDLHRLFSNDDFRFFDTYGNFIGDHLKVVEEITLKINNRYVDGKSIESDLSGPPWGYSFGTIVSSLAALFRAGKLSVKHNGDIWFSHEQMEVHDAFTNSTRYKSAAFKSVTISLSSSQKNQTVQLLLDLETEAHTGISVNWNANDFDLADVVRQVAEHFIAALSSLCDTVDDFEVLFPKVLAQKEVLQAFSGKVTENNYLERVEQLLTNSQAFTDAVHQVLKAHKFIKSNFSKVREYRRFIDSVIAELEKADQMDQTVLDAKDDFERLFKEDMVKNFGALQLQAQRVKDQYYNLVKHASQIMRNEYERLYAYVNQALTELGKWPEAPNANNKAKLIELKNYCHSRIVGEPVLEYSVSCKESGYSLSDMLNYTALVASKSTDLDLLEASFVKEAPAPYSKTGSSPISSGPKKVRFHLPRKQLSVAEFRNTLKAQLQAVAGMNDSDEIELDFN